MKTHVIPESIEAVILSHLREVTTEEVAVTQINCMKDDIDRFGLPFTARKCLTGILEGRLRGVRLHRPADQALQRELESSLAALAAMTSDEHLYSWTAKAASGYFSGISTALRSISIGASDLDHNPIT